MGAVEVVCIGGKRRSGRRDAYVMCVKEPTRAPAPGHWLQQNDRQMGYIAVANTRRRIPGTHPNPTPTSRCWRLRMFHVDPFPVE